MFNPSSSRRRRGVNGGHLAPRAPAARVASRVLEPSAAVPQQSKRPSIAEPQHPAPGRVSSRRRASPLLGLAAALVLCGCATGPRAEPSPPALAGTSWELVRFQSMDDSQGETLIDEPALYTVTFGIDGRTTMRLNCNRAMGSWQAAPAADGASGSLSFGMLAGTRALCPPPSLDEKLLRDLGYVRGYLLRDGELHMSLMADAGIYSWRPAQSK
jgi:heat shock protein HslJ